jgi:protein TonB
MAKPAVLTKRIAPEYPSIARQTRVQGVVRLNVTIGRDGLVHGIQVLNGHQLLTAAAVTAVKQWVYTPSLLEGQPQEVVTQVEVNFALH